MHVNLLIITSKSHIEDTLIITAETAAKYLPETPAEPAVEYLKIKEEK